MLFTDDTTVALQTAAALVNTAVEPDTLVDQADLEALMTRFPMTGRIDRSSAELAQLRALRGELATLWSGDELAVVQLSNQLLRRHQAQPQLVRHDEWNWHLHAVPGDAPLAARFAVEAAMAMADVLRAGQLDRLRHCAGAGCPAVVVDLSRNRSRRYCEFGCGNRAAVAAYRARQRQPEDA